MKSRVYQRAETVAPVVQVYIVHRQYHDCKLFLLMKWLRIGLSKDFIHNASLRYASDLDTFYDLHTVHMRVYYADQKP